MVSTYQDHFSGALLQRAYSNAVSSCQSGDSSDTPEISGAFPAVLNAVLDPIFIGWLGFASFVCKTTTVIAARRPRPWCIAYV